MFSKRGPETGLAFFSLKLGCEGQDKYFKPARHVGPKCGFKMGWKGENRLEQGKQIKVDET
jgi:hypothetical protein